MSLPSKRDQCQLSDGVIEAGFSNLLFKHINNLPLIQRDKSITCWEKE